MKIAAMTVCCVDRYTQHDADRVGGNSVNVATHCRLAGAEDVSVIGCVGEDAFGGMVRDHLRNHGIDTSHLSARSGRTTTQKIYIEDDGTLSYPPDAHDAGVSQAYAPSEEDWSFAMGHDILSIPSLDPRFREALDRIGNGTQLVIDFLHTRDYALVQTSLPIASLLFMSADDGAVDRMRSLSAGSDVPMILTLGERGSVALVKGQTFFQEALAAGPVVDTTGCGDAYQGAFVVSWFEHGDIAKAMQAGAQAASHILTHLGAV